MPYTTPVVSYNSGASATWYDLTGIQSVNISRGRQRFQDPVNQSSAVIELIPATSYTLELAVGQIIEIRETSSGSSNCFFQGRITDIQRSYAFPYNSSTNYAPADRITISATGGTGVLGTYQLSGYTLSTGEVFTSIANICTTNAMNCIYISPSNGVTNSGNTVTGAALDAINQLLRTGQVTLDDVVMQRTNPAISGVAIYPTGVALANIAFTDNSPNSSNLAYTGIEYVSSVQNTFNWVSVQATGLSPVVTSGSPPFNALNYTTYSASSPDATSLSNYVYAITSGQGTPVPYSISTNTMAASTCMKLAYVLQDYPRDTTQAVIGQQVAMTFRGSTSYGTVIGVNSAFYPDRASVQLYLSPSLGTPFTLDSSAFGVLDQNRLGFI